MEKGGDMTITYHCRECSWQGPEEDLGIASTDEGTHHYQCPECCGVEIELKKGEEDVSS
jgi:predicted RNA-binding Zn-ribbon protein involved in translation (DUF1610 family)